MVQTRGQGVCRDTTWFWRPFPEEHVKGNLPPQPRRGSNDQSPHLMEEGAMCHRDAQPAEAHPQDHVVRSIVAVAATLTGEESPDGFSAEDHSGGKSEQTRGQSRSRRATIQARRGRGATLPARSRGADSRSVGTLILALRTGFVRARKGKSPG